MGKLSSKKWEVMRNFFNEYRALSKPDRNKTLITINITPLTWLQVMSMLGQYRRIISALKDKGFDIS